MLQSAGCCEIASVVREAEAHSLDPRLLYESVIELANEGLMTAVGINAAANVLLTQLDLPAYFFRNITKEALQSVLRTLAGNIQLQGTEVVLRSEVSEARLSVDGGLQARVATAENRDRMELALNPVMNGNRVEYYYSPRYGYYTYIIHPEPCKLREELGPEESPFALTADPNTPGVTRRRYESFLRRCQKSITPVVEITSAEETDETRVMFRDDFSKSALPVMRQMLSELGLTLNRAYWETYRGATNRLESICSLYVAGALSPAVSQQLTVNLHAMLALQAGELDDMYVAGQLNFGDYIFAEVLAAFVHTFVHKDLAADMDIMRGLQRQELRDALAKRVFESNRAEYTREWIYNTIRKAPQLVHELHELFAAKFQPGRARRPGERALAKRLHAFEQEAAIVFVDDSTGFGIFHFASRLITQVLKTNYYLVRKRSFAFRLTPDVLDPLVYPGAVHGVFYVVGFYAQATHMRAADIARGGLRLIRVTPGNYETELDNMPLLNYALGPVAQRLKHKDIAESGSKGVIVPRPEFARDGLAAVYDLTEGIMDLVQPCPEVIDYLGRLEMIFFGPDEGTAGFMDAVAERGRERGYKYWRTLTTGKTMGIPHDVYGLTKDRRVFGLVPRDGQGTELQVDGVPALTTTAGARLAAKLQDRVTASGMTTMGVMACLREMLAHVQLPEAEVNLMMTGGPDGDLGANQIQSFRGRICLIVDGGSVLFDPDGLNRTELLKLAVARHTRPRLDSAAFPAAALGPRGWQVLRRPGEAKLPDGTHIADGLYFHRTFLANPDTRKLVAPANLQVFVPCGGFKDTINAANVEGFLRNFRELQVIVEGANVFFDDTARAHIAAETKVLHIKDSSANKGGVTSSSIAEVLTAFLLGDEYEATLADPAKQSALIRAVFELIAANAAAETRVLLQLHAATGDPLYQLSVRTSEQLLALQDEFYARLPELLADRDLAEQTVAAYVPGVLREWLGMKRIMQVLQRPELLPYRDALITKKLAALALYGHATEWKAFKARLREDFAGTVEGLLQA